ncbi:MAG: hypothetical protein ACTS9Y_01020 [Methylophilus sp.]|uniref:hypothetical protein n=1 Tax=Methylophilus sp. TaxID=29541 RepID=UPI003F9FD7A2
MNIVKLAKQLILAAFALLSFTANSATFDKFTATKGDKQGFVRLEWSMPADICPSAYGCGYRIKRNGSYIYNSVINTNGAVWDSKLSHDDFDATNNATYTYVIETFQDTFSGSGTIYGPQVGTTATDTGYAGDIYMNITATSVPGGVKLKWSPPAFDCPSQYGCGFWIYAEDGSTFYRSQIDVDGYTIDPTTEVTVPLNDTRYQRFAFNTFADSKPGVGVIVGRSLGHGTEIYGNALPSIQNFKASDGTAQGQVRITWNPIEMSCPSNDGCGFEIEQDGVSVFKSLTPTFPSGYTSRGKVWVGGTEYVQTLNDTATHLYKIKLFSVTRTGTTTNGTSAYIGTTDTDKGFAGETIKNFTASKGQYQGAIVAKVEAITGLLVSCPSTYGCGYEFRRDGVIVSQSLALTGDNTQYGSAWVGTNQYVDYVADQKVHEYQARIYAKELVSGTTYKATYIGTEAYDTGYALSNITNFTASKGEFPSVVKLSWSSQNCGTNAGCGVQLSRDGTVIKTSQILTNAYAFIEGTSYVQGGTFEDSPGPGIHTYKITAFWGNKVGSTTTMGKLVGEPQYVSGFTSASSVNIQNFSASDGSTVGSVKMQWDAAAGFDEIRVFEKTDSGENQIAVLGGNVGTYDYLVDEVSVKRFFVRGYNSGAANGVGSVVETGYAKAAFSSFKASDGLYQSRIQIEWNQVEGATQYELLKLNGSEWKQIYLGTNLNFSDAAVSTDTAFYRARALKDGVYFGGGSVADSGFAKTAVEGVDASDGTFAAKIYVTWNAVENATRYYVIRDGSVLENVTGKTEFMDKLVSDTNLHAYSIRAFDSTGKQIGTDSAVNYGFAGQTFTKFTATKGTVFGAVELEWNPVAEATSYKVTRNGVTTTGVYGTTYVDSTVSGTTQYYYYVQAYKANGAVLGIRSSQISGYASSDLATPKNVKASDGSAFDKITISWTPVMFCVNTPCNFAFQSPNPTNTNVQSYKIWRDNVELAVIAGNVTSYVDSSAAVQGGKSFNYWVEALDPANKVINVRSGGDVGSTMADVATPKNFTASDGVRGKVVLNWLRSIGATGYAIFRDGVQIATVDATKASYTDTSIVSGKVYSYQVASMSGSTVFTKTSVDPGYSMLDAVTNASASQGTVTESIVVKWDKKESATSYIVVIDDSVSKIVGLTNGFDATTNTYSYRFNDIEDTEVHKFYVIPRIGTNAGDSVTVTGYANFGASSVSASGETFNGVEVEMTPKVVDVNKNESFTFNVPVQPANGSASVRNGKIVYRSNSTFSGVESFDITVTDKGNEDTTGKATVKVSCLAPTLTIGTVLPANLKAYRAGKVDVTLNASGCISNYKIDYVLQKRNSTGEWETFTGSSFPSVSGGQPQTINFDSLDAGNYQLVVTGTDLNSNAEPVVKFSSITVSPYNLPTIVLNKKLVVQATEEVIATVADPSVKDCEFTFSGAVFNSNPTTHCLIQWETVPVGMHISTDRSKMSGVIDSFGTKNISALISVNSPAQGKVVVGRIVEKVDVTALTELKFSAPESIDVVQFLSKADFSVKKGSENTCELTTNLESAMNSYGDKNFRCLLEFDSLPQSLNKTYSGFNGYFTEVGTSNIGWTVSYFKRGTEKLLVKSGNVSVNVTAAEIDYDLDKLVDRPLQLITTVNLSLKKVGKNSCPLTTWNDADAPGKCLVEWTELPDGIAQNSDIYLPKLEGMFNQKGVQTIKFAISFININGTKTLIQEKQASFDVEEAPQPKISFADGNIISDDILGYPKQGGIASRLVVDATRASVEGEVTFTQNASNDFKFSVKGGKRSRVLLVRAAPLWSEQSASVKLRMKDNTTLAAAKTVTLVSIPDLKVRPELMIVNNTYGDEGPAKIKMRIGEYRKGGFAYVPVEMGTWKMRLLTRVNGVFVPASEFKSVNEIGETEVELPVVGMAVARLMVEAMAVSPSNPLVEVKRLSRYRDIRIVKGKPIDGKLTIKSDRPSSGAAPFNIRFETKLDGKADVAALGAFNLEISKDGSDWVTNEDKKCRLLCNILFYEGRYQVRAHFVNKNSGAESYSEPLDVYAYDAINLKMEGANVYYPNDKVDLIIKTTNSRGQDVAANIEWNVTSGTSRDGSTMASGTGDRVSFTNSKSGTLYVTARAVRSDIDDPTVKDFVMNKFTVLYKAIRKPKVVVIGPKVAETDVVQTFNAQVITDFEGSNTKLKTVGEWTLPDGQKVPGNVLNWMPDASDKSFANLGKVNLIYSAWVEGYKDETFVSINRPLGLWTYVWPEFTMKATLTKNVAPTTATLVVTPDDEEAFRKINSKDITYSWNIDPELILNRVTAGTAKLSIPLGGSFMAGVTISDKRGNSTSLEVPLSSNDISDIFVKMNIANASRHSHAPLDISVNTQVTGGANGDFVKDIAYDLDGAPLDFGNKSFGKVLSIPRGNHNINVKVTTNYGKVGTQTANFEVKDNVPPVCELKITPIDNRDAYLEVSCTDPDGRIKLYDWTVDNVNIGARSFRWKYRKSSDKANIPVSVEITDSGDAKVRVNGIVP